MASDRPPQPVNGEILAAQAAGRSGGRRPDDAVDADFETIEVPQAVRPPSARPVAAAIARESLSILNGSAPVADRPSRGGPAFWATGILAVAAAFWFSGGHALLDHRSSPALSDEAAGFEVMEVTSSVKRLSGRDVLMVDGVLQNTGMRDAVAPDIMVNVESDTGGTTRYLLGLGKPVVAAGDTADFSSRLNVPKGGVKRIYITFEEGK